VKAVLYWMGDASNRRATVIHKTSSGEF
jgi:hypothetical protein